MFRRRAQRIFRGLGKLDVPPMLQQANQLMAAGDYAGAAVAFNDLAQRAEARFPQRAPFLFMEAGRAAILSGQTKNWRCSSSARADHPCLTGTYPTHEGIWSTGGRRIKNAQLKR